MTQDTKDAIVRDRQRVRDQIGRSRSRLESAMATLARDHARKLSGGAGRCGEKYPGENAEYAAAQAAKANPDGAA